jgi:hypothetical protein
MRSFLIGQVARTAQLVEVVAGAVFGSPREEPRERRRLGTIKGIASDPDSSRGNPGELMRAAHEVSGRTPTGIPTRAGM